MKCPAVPFAMVTLLVCVGVAQRPSMCCAQTPGDPIANSDTFEIAKIDADTRWAFRVVSPVTVGSPIIRLGDVVQPLDPNMAGWQRLRRSPVGLVPIGGQPMTIQRDRLAQAISDAEATPLAIDWIGPKIIKVIYRESNVPSAVQPASHTGGRDGVIRVGYDDESTPQPASRLATDEAERIIHWIHLALKREIPKVAETYAIEIDRNQSGLVGLQSISGVTSVELRDDEDEGLRRFHVVARSINGAVESDIMVMLEAHPTIAVPRKSFSRGHRIEPGDLVLQPLPASEMEAGYVLDPDEVVGLEVRGAVRANQPVHHRDLGAPILIHRGDLIEVRVVGGGITVTTNAKSIGDGAESDLIEVETLQPRRRLVARVVSPGVVEIVTRAPRVRP